MFETTIEKDLQYATTNAERESILLIFITNDEYLLSGEDINENFDEDLYTLLKETFNRLLKAAGWFIDCISVHSFYSMKALNQSKLGTFLFESNRLYNFKRVRKRTLFFWYRWWDSNPHGFPLDFESLNDFNT